ncbi:MAG TPA: alpha/beta hydrolase [Candidatus Acidoferrales bacterium]|nr:alpha/beta hydrolase [Candidatus Acidoferrales bacterium]
MDTSVPTPDGAELFVRVVGAGAPVVVPLACWNEEFETLADRSQVVLYDPRGRGRSSAIAPGCASFEQDVRDLEAVREHLDLEMIALAGSSYFGGVVARYAMRHPERVARLVLVGSTPVRAGSFFRAVQEEQNARLRAVAPDLMREMAAGGPQTPEHMKAFWDAFVDTRTAVKPPWPAKKSRPSQFSNEAFERVFPLVGAAMRSMGDWDWREDARAIDAPVLVLDGSADILPVEACREWLGALPNARALVMDCVGHFPAFEAPERFFAVLREFLMGDWPAACTTSL